MPDRLRLPSVRWSVWLRCLCASDGQLGQYTLCLVHTLGSLIGELNCQWWGGERERWGGGERRNRGGEERGRLVEKQSELTAVYTYTYVTAVLEISEALMRAHMDVNFYTPNLYFQLFTLQSHFTRSHPPKHTQVKFCLPKVMVWPSDVKDAFICWNLVFKVLKFLFYNNWDYVSCIQ